MATEPKLVTVGKGNVAAAARRLAAAAAAGIGATGSEGEASASESGRLRGSHFFARA